MIITLCFIIPVAAITCVLESFDELEIFKFKIVNFYHKCTGQLIVYFQLVHRFLPVDF